MADIIPFPDRLTDAQFEQWLDEHPGRREAHSRKSPERRHAQRAYVERLHVLRASAIASDLAALRDLGRAFRDAAHAVVKKYAPDEAARVLAGAGLPAPHELDAFPECGAGKFEESHSACRKVAKAVEGFLDTIETEVQSVLPIVGRAA
ncbi:unnamed protein product [Gemmata massiliana]|uniref:Uncharacterized protein n=1 Tax=Gemmata massiliana TaxID=1210884 RepID=A0A6P2CX56_9BACT|nr:hypothetical protein [Gemmata massiliana]VTR93581.1 unnamed protein product [Gemmata massiliana]